MKSSELRKSIDVRSIRTTDAAAFRELRIEALRTCPLAFSADVTEAEARPMDQWHARIAEATGEGTQVIVLADAGDRLAGMTGVYTDKAPKVAHIGTVWGVYVREEYRGRGIGESLIRACIDWSRARGLLVLRLGVAVGNDAAQRCYERCGFTVYGTEPAALRWEGKLYDENLMAIRLG